MFFYTLSALRRNALSLLITSLFLSLLFLVIHLLSFGALFSQSLLENFEKKADIPVFIQTDASESRVDAFRNELQKKKSAHEIIDFWELQKSDAWESFQKKNPTETHFFQEYKIENPFSTVFGIIPSGEGNFKDNVEQWLLSDYWKGLIDRDRFQETKNIRMRVENFLHLTSVSEEGIFILQIFFALIAATLVFYSVFLLVRSHTSEISIMRLVGARIFFIRIPFVLEGLCVSFLSLCISVFLFWWFFSLFSVWISQILFQLSSQESFLVEFIENTSVFSSLLMQNCFFLFLFTLFASLIAGEYTLRTTRT